MKIDGAAQSRGKTSHQGPRAKEKKGGMTLSSAVALCFPVMTFQEVGGGFCVLFVCVFWSFYVFVISL